MKNLRNILAAAIMLNAFGLITAEEVVETVSTINTHTTTTNVVPAPVSITTPPVAHHPAPVAITTPPVAQVIAPKTVRVEAAKTVTPPVIAPAAITKTDVQKTEIAKTVVVDGVKVATNADSTTVTTKKGPGESSTSTRHEKTIIDPVTGVKIVEKSDTTDSKEVTPLDASYTEKAKDKCNTIAASLVAGLSATFSTVFKYAGAEGVWTKFFLKTKEQQDAILFANTWGLKSLQLTKLNAAKATTVIALIVAATALYKKYNDANKLENDTLLANWQ